MAQIIYIHRKKRIMALVGTLYTKYLICKVKYIHLIKVFEKDRYTVMERMLEIRWHGRGGQGAKTAALLLADVAFKTGQYVQGRVHSNIYHPDFVIVVDETLLHSVHVTDGLKREGAVIVNTPRTAEEIRPLLQGYSGAVYTVDARAISEETLGRNFPNTPMLAAAVAVSGVMEKEDFLREMRASFLHKFARKPEVVSGNMKALEMACEVIEKTAGMNRSA